MTLSELSIISDWRLQSVLWSPREEGVYIFQILFLAGTDNCCSSFNLPENAYKPVATMYVSFHQKIDNDLFRKHEKSFTRNTF